MNKFNKSLGIILLFLGIAVILYPIYFSFKIIEGEKSIPAIFKEISLKKSNNALSEEGVPSSGNLQEDMEKKARQIISQELSNLFPVENINQFFNLIAWSIIAGVIIFAGAQLSQLGIRLLKN